MRLLRQRVDGGQRANAPPVVQLEQLQPPRGLVAGFSSEAELSQQQVELQEQQQLLLRRQQKGSCSSFGAFWCCRLVFRGAKKQCPQVSQLIRELHTPGQSSFHLLCFLPPGRRCKKGYWVVNGVAWHRMH